MTTAITFAATFFAALLGDVFWTLYFMEVEARRAHRAALWSSMIIGLGAFTIVNYIEDHRMFIASLLGAYIGTYITVKYKPHTDEGKTS